MSDSPPIHGPSMDLELSSSTLTLAEEIPSDSSPDEENKKAPPSEISGDSLTSSTSSAHLLPNLRGANETIPHSPRTLSAGSVSYPEIQSPPPYNWREIVKTRFSLEFWGIFISLPGIFVLWVCGYYTQLFYIKWLDDNDLDRTPAPVSGHGVLAIPFVAFVGLSSYSSSLFTWCFVFEDIPGTVKRLFKPILFYLPSAIILPIVILINIMTPEIQGLVGILSYLYAQVYYFYSARVISRTSNTPDNIDNFALRFWVCQFILAIVIFTYSTILGDIYFDKATPTSVVFFLRIIIHPMISELAITPFRLFCIYCDEYYEPGSQYRFHWLLYPFQFIFALYGRFLVLSLPDVYLQVAMILILAIEDQVFRLSMRQRDTWYLKILGSFKKRLSFERAMELTNKPHLYSAYFIGDELLELCSIFLAPFVLAFYNMAPNADDEPQSLISLLLITLLGVLAESLIDCLRTYAYADKTSGKNRDEKPPRNFIEALLLKWKNSWMILDQQIHHQWLMRSEKFTFYSLIQNFLWVLYFTNAFMSIYVCARRTSSGVVTYFCPSDLG